MKAIYLFFMIGFLGGLILSAMYPKLPIGVRKLIYQIKKPKKNGNDKAPEQIK